MAETASAAALLIRLPQAVLSHEEAARRLGIELIDDDGMRRITVPRSCGRVTATGWRVSRADLKPAETLVLQDGSRVTAPLRTALDLARVLTLTGAVTAADSALRRELVKADELLDGLRSGRGNGSAQQREVAELLDPLSGSVLESALRVLLVTSGIPAPATQFWVADGGRALRASRLLLAGSTAHRRGRWLRLPQRPGLLPP